ncbi:MAG: glycosyltransferase family 4 protein [Caldisphaera sp.]
MQEMKIALVVDRIYPFFIGGYEIALYNIFRRMGEEMDITVYTTKNKDIQIPHLKIENISDFSNYTNMKDVHSVKGILIFFYNLFMHLRKIGKNDIVFISTIPYLGYPLFLKMINSRVKVSIFYEAWFNYPESVFIRLLLRRIIKGIVNGSSEIIAISSVTALSLKENYGVQSVRVIPLGLDLDIIDKTLPGDKGFDVIFVGRLSSIKRINDLIIAVSILKEDRISVNTGILGDGPQLNELKEMTSKLGIKEITFLGKVSEEEKYSILKSSRVFVNPSEREGFSIATLEAMACGCVPIVSKPEIKELFGTSHFVRNMENGLYYEVGDYREMAEKIRILLENDDIYYKLKANALTEARKYTWDKAAEEYKKMISDLRAF